MTVKNTSAIKSLHQFLDTLEVKLKTGVHRFCAAKLKCKAIKSGIILLSSITKRHSHTNINQQVKKVLYYCILQHPHVVVSPISNNCLKLSIGGQVKPQLLPKLLLRSSVRELHNIMMFAPEEGGLKKARDADNNIIISDSTLCNILTIQLKKMSYQYKVMCGCECCISAKSMHSSLLTWRYFCLKHRTDRSHSE